jgi:hypothetical protein
MAQSRIPEISIDGAQKILEKAFRNRARPAARHELIVAARDKKQA